MKHDMALKVVLVVRHVLSIHQHPPDQLCFSSKIIIMISDTILQSRLSIPVVDDG